MLEYSAFVKQSTGDLTAVSAIFHNPWFLLNELAIFQATFQN